MLFRIKDRKMSSLYTPITEVPTNQPTVKPSIVDDEWAEELIKASSSENNSVIEGTVIEGSVVQELDHANEEWPENPMMSGINEQSDSVLMQDSVSPTLPLQDQANSYDVVNSDSEQTQEPSEDHHQQAYLAPNLVTQAANEKPKKVKRTSTTAKTNKALKSVTPDDLAAAFEQAQEAERLAKEAQDRLNKIREALKLTIKSKEIVELSDAIFSLAGRYQTNHENVIELIMERLQKN